MKLFDLFATIRLDARKFNEDMKEAQGKGATLAGSLSASLGGLAKSAGLAAAGKKLLDLAGESIELASNLEEVQNVVDTTFGDDAASINTWAKGASEAYGLTELQAKRYTSTLGAMMKSSGLTGTKVAEMSKSMAGLAADMASFYNLDFDTAFDKIRSGISGETEPLKQLGVNMSEANLQAFAMQHGFEKLYKDMDSGEKTIVRYQYLLQATADAQGDFARTSDGYANSVRILENSWTELKTTLGEALLPTITNVVNGINGLFDSMKPVETLTDTFSDIDKSMKESANETIVQAYRANSLVGILRELEGQTELTDAQQRLWNTTLAELQRTVPGVSALIDMQTMSIKGGTDALALNIEAMKNAAMVEGQRNALKAKTDALTEAYEKQATAQMNLCVQERNLEALQANKSNVYAELARELGATLGTIRDMNGSALKGYVTAMQIEQGFDLSDKAATLLDDAVAYADSVDIETKAIAANKKAMEENDAAIRQSEIDLEKSTKAFSGTEEPAKGATEAIEDMTAALENLTGQREGLETMGAKLRDYADNVRASARSMADGVFTAFEEVDFKEIGVRTAGEIMAGLNSQEAYWKSYAANLDLVREKLKASGYDDSFLNSFADGSKESYAYLQAMAGMDDTQIKDAADSFLALNESQETVTGKISDMRLGLDAEYQAMQSEYETLVAAFNASADATANISLTYDALDAGLKSMYDDTAAWVQAMNDMMSTIGSVSLSLPSLTTNDGGGAGVQPVAQKHATGLESVPYDGYRAILHRDEAVLTKSEARTWREGGGEADIAGVLKELAAMMQQAAGNAGGAQIVLDSGVLVGQLAPAMDRALGNISAQKARR